MVAVRDVDRRVLRIYVAEEVGELGLITCGLGLSRPFGQTHSSERARFGSCADLLAMDVVDAEGLDDCADGEDETRGNGR